MSPSWSRTARPGSVFYRSAPVRLPLAAAGCLLASVLVVGEASGRSPSDPLDPGLVWSSAPAAASPWVPRSVAITGRDTLVWGAGSVGNPRLMAFSLPGEAASEGATDALFQDASVADAVGILAVASGAEGKRLFALAQRPNPDDLNRRSQIRAYDPAAAARSGSFEPVWTHDVLGSANGPARVAVSGSGGVVVGAAWDDKTGEVHVHWLDGKGDSGLPTATATFPAVTLSEVVISDDGSRVALTAGLKLRVFDANGGVLYEDTLASATRAIALSGDGRVLLVGGIGGLDVFVEGPGGYQRDHVVTAAGNEIATEVDISPDGTLYAIGWWVYTTGVSLRFELRDGATHAQLAEVVQTGVTGGLQNRPQKVVVSRDGRRAVLGAWGDGASAPEVVLLERGRQTPVLELDLAGSVQDLALDGTGTRIAVAVKSTHANHFSSTGAIEVYSTGEDDVALRRGPEVGGTLELEARRPGASLVLFLVGRRRSTPLVFEGAGGELWLERTRRMLVYPTVPDSSGLAEHCVPIPDAPSLIGTRKSIQAAFRIGDEMVFGKTVVNAWFL